ICAPAPLAVANNAAIAMTETRARERRLRTRSTDVIELIEADEHVARLRAIRRTENARRMKLIDDTRRATITDLEASLQERRRSLLVLHHDLGGLAEQLVAIADVGGLALGLAGLLRLTQANLLENVRLGLGRLLEDDALRRQRGALCFATIG